MELLFLMPLITPITITVAAMVFFHRLKRIQYALEELVRLQTEPAATVAPAVETSERGQGSDKGPPPDRSPMAGIGDFSKVGSLKKFN